MTGADTRYMTCQLKADRARLTVAFQQMKPVTRKAGFETLNHLLRRAKSFGELPIIKRTQCWKTGKSLQTQWHTWSVLVCYQRIPTPPPVSLWSLRNARSPLEVEGERLTVGAIQLPHSRVKSTDHSSS